MNPLQILMLLPWVALAQPGKGLPQAFEEAPERCREIIEHAQERGKIPPCVRAWSAEPLLGFLDSSDPRIRQLALRALHGEALELHLEGCLRHFQGRLPPQEQGLLLAICLRQFRGYGAEDSSGEAREQVLALAREWLASPRPPSLLEIALCTENGGGGGLRLADLLEGPRKEKMAQQLLLLLGRVQERGARNHLFELVLSLGEPPAGEALKQWYQLEPDPSLRRIVVDAARSWAKDPSWASRRRRILELAVNDWDAEVAEQARILLRH